MKLTYRLLLSGIVLALSACSNLEDVNHKWCSPTPNKTNTQIVLKADALFPFDKSSEKDLLLEGKASLDELVTKLATDFVNIDAIHLIGHTDYLGSDSYNYLLGQKRANTIKQYLESKGVKAPITASSKGEKEPVVTCEKMSTSQKLKSCLQPNRRVVVDIKGVEVSK